jgi:hypothetical protein
MKNILLIVLYIIVSVSPTLAEEGNEAESDVISLEIMVIDAVTEEPIPAAKIILDQKATEAYTDFDGLVKLNEIQKGSHEIEISFVSYQKQHFKSIVLDQATKQILVKLQP